MIFLFKHALPSKQAKDCHPKSPYINFTTVFLMFYIKLRSKVAFRPTALAIHFLSSDCIFTEPPIYNFDVDPMLPKALDNNVGRFDIPVHDSLLGSEVNLHFIIFFVFFELFVVLHLILEEGEVIASGE
jgi:hypothetical protein